MQRAYAKAVELGQVVPEAGDATIIATVGADLYTRFAALLSVTMAPDSSRAAFKGALGDLLIALTVFARVEAGADIEDVFEEAMIARESVRRPAPAAPPDRAPDPLELRFGSLRSPGS